MGAIQNLKKIGHLLDIWADAGADGVAFTVPFDMLDKRFFDNTKSARDRGMRVLIHPVEMGEKTCTSSDPSTHSYMLERIGFTIDMIRTQDLEPLLVLHPPRLAAPNTLICGKKELGEEEAFRNAVPFLDKLARIVHQSPVSIAIENMHDPYANPEHSLLGYTTQQLESLCDGRGFGICVDTGHAKLSRTTVSEYLNSPLNILAIHLQGNDGSYDQHMVPTSKNIGDTEGVLKLLSLDIPIVVETNSYWVLEQAEKSREALVSRLSSTLDSIRERSLPAE
ncbi:MAG: TIM barrel protein [Candidatus Micrarchaeota archaeon]